MENLSSLLNGVTVVRGAPDSCTWIVDPEGLYSVHSPNKMLQGPTLGESDPIFKAVGTKTAPSNICGFVWKVVHDRLPNRINFFERIVIIYVADVCCPLCTHEEETLDYLLIICPIVARVWVKCY